MHKKRNLPLYIVTAGILLMLAACMTTPGQWAPELAAFHGGMAPESGKVWWTTVIVSESAGSSWEPSLAVDATGNVHVAWQDYTSRNIFYRRWNATSDAWTTAEVVFAGWGDSNYPSLAVDGAGNVHVAWHDEADYAHWGTSYDIFYRRWNVSTGVWSTTEWLSNQTGVSYDPSLVVDATGDVHVAWQGWSGGDYEIIYRRWDATSGVWGTTVAISDNTAVSHSPSLAVDETGDVHVAWMDWSVGGWDILYRRWNATSGVWGTTENVSENEDVSGEPSLAVDVEGNVHVAWRDVSNYAGSGTDADIFYRCWNVTSGAWGTTEVLSENAGDSMHPSLAVDDAGNVHVAWMDYSVGGCDILYRRWNATWGVWSTTEDVSENPGYSENPSLVVDSAGNLHVAWEDATDYPGTGVHADILYRKQAVNIAPVLTVPANVTYVNGSVGHIISWMVTDASASTPTYTLFDNNSSIASGAWSSFVPISYNVDGLTIGTHNLTIVASDGNNVSVQDTVFVNVLNGPPSVTQPPNITFVPGQPVDLLSWTITDAGTALRSYTIYCNGTSIANSSWVSGTPITRSIGNLPIGIYNYTIVAADGLGESVRNTVIVTVIPNGLPSITHPADVTYTVGRNGNTISWTITDVTTNICTYTIYCDGTLIATGSWTSGIPVTISVDGLARGMYNYTIVVTDGLNGSAQDTVIIPVEADITLVIAGIVIGIITAIIGVITIRSKHKAIANRVRSIRDAIVSKWNAPGRVDEVLYRRPEQEPPAQKPKTSRAKAKHRHHKRH